VSFWWVYLLCTRSLTVAAGANCAVYNFLRVPGCCPLISTQYLGLCFHTILTSLPSFITSPGMIPIQLAISIFSFFSLMLTCSSTDDIQQSPKLSSLFCFNIKITVNVLRFVKSPQHSTDIPTLALRTAHCKRTLNPSTIHVI